MLRPAIRRTYRHARNYRSASTRRTVNSWRKKAIARRKKVRNSKYARNRMTRYGTSIRCKGIRRRIKKTPELKWTTSANLGINGLIPNNNFLNIWNPNTRNLGSSTVWNLVTPGQGVTDASYVGSEFNSLYAKVRISFSVATFDNYFDFFRIVVARPRQQNLSLNSTANYATPSSYIALFDPKIWDVWYDKTRSISTGYAQTTGHATKPWTYEFNIPLKQTVRILPDIADTKQYYERPPQIMCISKSQSVSIIDFYCRFFYNDP